MPGRGGDSGGSEEAAAEHPDKSQKNTASVKAPATGDLQRGPTLRVEILGDSPIRRALGADHFDRERRYRVDADERRKLLKLPELKKLVDERQASASPFKKVQIVLYDDSPDEGTPAVRNLNRWVKDEKGLELDISNLKADAP